MLPKHDVLLLHNLGCLSQGWDELLALAVQAMLCLLFDRDREGLGRERLRKLIEFLAGLELLKALKLCDVEFSGGADSLSALWAATPSREASA